MSNSNAFIIYDSFGRIVHTKDTRIIYSRAEDIKDFFKNKNVSADNAMEQIKTFSKSINLSTAYRKKPSIDKVEVECFTAVNNFFSSIMLNPLQYTKNLYAFYKDEEAVIYRVNSADRKSNKINLHFYSSKNNTYTDDMTNWTFFFMPKGYKRPSIKTSDIYNYNYKECLGVDSLGEKVYVGDYVFYFGSSKPKLYKIDAHMPAMDKAQFVLMSKSESKRVRPVTGSDSFLLNCVKFLDDDKAVKKYLLDVMMS